MGNWARQARLALSQKDYMQAGDFFKLDHDYRAAAKAYLRGDHYVEAAKVFEETGAVGKAEKLLRKHGGVKDMAEFFARHGKHEDAVEYYLENDMRYDAAELLEKLNQLPRAAELYADLGFEEKAGVLFAKARAFDQAIDIFSRVVRKLEEGSDSNTMPKILKFNDWIANLHLGAKRYNQAGQVFEEIQDKEKAAKCYIKGGNHLRAGQLLLELGNRDEAKKVLAEVDSREGRILRGQIALAEKDYRSAIRLLKDTDHYASLSDAYEQLGRFKEAGHFREKMGELVKAADLYAKGRDFARSALLYEQNGLYEKAAQNYERLKKHGHAAKFYHLAKKRYKAGVNLYRINRLEDALKQLQLLEEDDPNFMQAQVIMAEIFFKQGVFSVARKMLEEMISSITLSDASLPTFYLLARCYEEEGDLATARSYYDRILARKFDYADVRRRLKRMQGEVTHSGVNQTVGKKPDADGKIRLNVGDLIAERFKIMSTIGKGGMGYIFKVRDLSLDRDIALKMLINERANYEELKVELLIARDLTHPYIIKVFDVGQWMGVGYFTMEHVEGVPLKKYIQKNTDDVPKKVEFLIKVCEGLKHAHDEGVVHRDIKPQNILVDQSFNPKILDFGIARKVTQGVKSGSISGSPKYMAPEQIQNLNTDLRTDVYAMGIIMFYMFTEKEPFVGKTPQEVMLMHLNDPLPDPFERNPNLPFWLCDIIKRCCQKSPDLRFLDMGELVEELRLNLVGFS